LPKRIIEVPSDPTLPPGLCISNGAEPNYLFLSNRSGDVEFTKLTSSNIASFQKGTDPKSLPKTFVDATDLTRRLGYQYLSIRHLCILQDNKTDWNEESSKLISTYGQASLMILADVAKDANAGISTNRHIYYSSALGNKDRYPRLYHPRPYHLRLKMDIEYSPLAGDTRAGIERMLAPRIVHLT